MLAEDIKMGCFTSCLKVDRSDLEEFESPKVDTERKDAESSVIGAVPPKVLYHV